MTKHDIKSKIRTIPDWPKKGVMFRDITTLIKDGDGFRHACDMLYDHYKGKGIDVIAGIESRGFVFGAVLAYKMGKGFVVIRKPGKLPAETVSASYEKEYGPDSVEMHADSIKKGDKVLMVDDLLATGGTMEAACRLVQKVGGKIVGCAFVIELPELRGRNVLGKYEIFKLVDFEGE
ncbi:MAG: adenine phosphoribosyltransferase [Candidatus Aenigmarchaeota archaeon]|nr:adenine phosphoribosyltransferase [Candidatus Aenigmarchaeota archaeon]